MTIHRSKGKEYNRVVLNITPATYSENKINVTQVLCNPDIYSDNLNGTEGEYVRIIYVGASRAIRKLKIFVPGDKSDMDEFIKAINQYKDSIGLQDDFLKVQYD